MLPELQVVRLQGVSRDPKELAVLLAMARAAVQDAAAAASAAGLPPFNTTGDPSICDLMDCEAVG